MPKNNIVSDEEIEEYYQNNIQDYTILIVEELSVNDRNIAEKIRESAIKGKKFHDIKSHYEESREKVIVRRLTIPPKQNDLFDSFDIGNVSDVKERSNQFIILKIIDVQKVPLPIARKRIVQTILELERKNAVNDYIENLKKEKDIKVKILTQ